MKTKDRWSFDQVAQNATTELVNSSRTYTYYFVCKQFFQIISAEGFGGSNKEAKELIRKVFLLFCLESVEREISLLLEFGYFTPDHARSVRRSFSQLCRELRTHAVVLVDAYDLPDFILKSPLQLGKGARAFLVVAGTGEIVDLAGQKRRARR